jgi:hypothetical protein
MSTNLLIHGSSVDGSVWNAVRIHPIRSPLRVIAKGKCKVVGGLK